MSGDVACVVLGVVLLVGLYAELGAPGMKR